MQVYYLESFRYIYGMEELAVYIGFILKECDRCHGSGKRIAYDSYCYDDSPCDYCDGEHSYRERTFPIYPPSIPSIPSYIK